MKIYIANIAGTVTCAQLRDLFAPFGTVSRSELALDIFRNVSRGFGWVTMKDADARAAIRALDNCPWHGQRISVRAEPVEPAPFSAKRSRPGPEQPYTFLKN